MKGIIFDLGHTLMDFQGEWEEVTEQAGKSLLSFFNKRGVDVPLDFPNYLAEKRQMGMDEANKTSVEYTAERAFRETIEKFELNGKVEDVLPEAIEAYFGPETENWHAYPDSLQVLQELVGRGYRIGLASNATDHLFILSCMEKLGFDRYVNPIISSAGFRVRKPNPEIFLHVAKQWKIHPSKIVMIGDQLYFDIFGAHLAGMRGIWVRRNSEKAYTFIPEELKNDLRLVPDKTIDELSEIPDILKSL